jgi:phytoene/squalene synthetase
MDLLAKHGYPLEYLFALKFDDRFRSVMRDAVAVADTLFRQGLPLITKVNRRLALDLELFSRGGIKILEKIRLQDYNVLQGRPYISKAERLTLMLRCLPRLLAF